ncbi:MAG: hypothetical protein KDA75_03065 [Planctomycetaceae bacterium]|nr:hypothetical protein [Planctomycetaceae bacterium]
MQKPITRPGERPGLGNGGGPPVQIGGGGKVRPSVGDRLPGQGEDRPNIGDRLPGANDNRPNLADRRPGVGENRPGLGDGRVDFGNRPDWLDNRGPNFNTRINNNTWINNRPSWVNIDRSTNVNIHNRWNNAFVRPGAGNWWTRPSNRLSYWHGWGDGVRHSWSHYHNCHNWYTGNWWSGHPHAMCGWHYHWNWGRYPPNYWWGVPTWAGLTSWFVWSAAAPPVWQQPVYYDYGSGGNVTYENNYVYIGGEQVASADEFAQSAAELATVAPPATDQEAKDAEWMPLGTFIVTSGEQDVDPSRTVQLAVSKQGIIAGTLYNAETDQAQSVQGQVDKETQRVALRIGESDSLVIETGLYNLTQNEVPLLVHFGADRQENWMLVRLEDSADG